AWLAAGFAVTATAIGWQAVSGRISIAALVTSVLCLMRIFNPPNTMPDISIVYGSMTVANVERAVDQVVVSVPRPASPVPPPVVADRIELHDVQFGYGDALVFDGLELTIPAGQQLPIVGL